MKSPLIIFLGECNSCGFLSKRRLTEEELGIWPEVQILNNRTMIVESLDMRHNHALCHATLKDNQSYGWELFLAKQVRGGLWPANPVYLVKAGQGGTRAYHYTRNVSNYYQIFLMRVNAMRVQIGDCTPIIWYQQGANEPEQAPDDEDFKTNVCQLFHNIREDMGKVPIIMTKQLPKTARLNPACEEIARMCSQVTLIGTDEANMGVSDGAHWKDTGYQITADLMHKATLDYWK